MKESFWLKPGPQMDRWAIISGIGFLVYLGLSVLNWEIPALIAAIVFGLIALFVFFSAMLGRSEDKDAVGYNAIWGSGALALMMLGLAVMTIRSWLGI